MKIHQKFERKYRADLPVHTVAHALSIQFGFGSSQIELYYDRPEATPFLRGIFLRIRDDRHFGVKVNLDDLRAGKSLGHTYCKEIQTGKTFTLLERIALEPILYMIGLELGPSTTCDDLFARNGLIASLSIRKTCYEVQTQWGMVRYDDPEDLGSFIEIEANVADAFADAVTQLGVIVSRMIDDRELTLEDAGYNSLAWRTRDFSVYSRCHYVLSSNKRRTHGVSLP